MTVSDLTGTTGNHKYYLCTSARGKLTCGALLAETIRQDRASEKVVAHSAFLYTRLTTHHILPPHNAPYYLY